MQNVRSGGTVGNLACRKPLTNMSIDIHCILSGFSYVYLDCYTLLLAMLYKSAVHDVESRSLEVSAAVV